MTEPLRAPTTPSIPSISENILLEARNLSCRLAGRQIIGNINVKLFRGEILGLIGPNGAGKSTLLKSLMAYYECEGELSVGGHDLRKLEDRSRHIAYIGQQEEHQLSFSVLEIVEMACYGGLSLGGRLLGSSYNSKIPAQRALEYLGLGNYAERIFNRLSGGEQQLVRFARALAQDTAIFLLDEPTANLDIAHEKVVLEMLAELTREGKGVIIAIHNLNMAAEFCDRLLLMKDGSIVTEGSPEEVLQREHVQRAYETDVNISPNLSSGSAALSLPRTFRQEQDVRVHIIGGGGSSVNLTRQLTRSGFRVSGGVAHRLDSDTRLWESLNIPMVCVEAFSDIDDTAYDEALALLQKADYTLLAPFPVGRGNLRNLALAAQAAQANRLIIVEDTRNERAFHCPEAGELFRQARAGAELLNFRDIPDFFTGLRSSGAFR